MCHGIMYHSRALETKQALNNLHKVALLEPFPRQTPTPALSLSSSDIGSSGFGQLGLCFLVAPDLRTQVGVCGGRGEAVRGVRVSILL
jgi:hypothetical protein